MGEGTGPAISWPSAVFVIMIEVIWRTPVGVNSPLSLFALAATNLKTLIINEIFVKRRKSFWEIIEIGAFA